VSENPYQSPEYESSTGAVGVKSGRREDLCKVAASQRGVLVCILIYLVCVLFSLVSPPEIGIVIAVIAIVNAIAGLVFVFRLAIQVYSTSTGVVLGLLTLVPFVGLIVLLVVNGKATNILKENGIKVGLLGANPSQI